MKPLVKTRPQKQSSDPVPKLFVHSAGLTASKACPRAEDWLSGSGSLWQVRRSPATFLAEGAPTHCWVPAADAQKQRAQCWENVLLGINPSASSG